MSGDSFNGKTVQKGTSYLKDSLNREMFDKKLTIIDKPVEDFFVSSAPIDTEGVSTGQIIMVDNGRINSFIFDLQTAGVLGKESTGSGYRSYASLPSPGSTNIFVKPGNITSDKIISGITDGILIDDFIGLGQSNVLAGEFSANIGLGFKIVKGEITGRVKDCMVAGNVFELFSSIGEISSDVSVSGYSSMPYFFFSGLSLAHK